MERATATPARETETAPEREPAAPAGGPLGPAAVLALQRTAGNAAVTALLSREPVAEKSAAPTPREALRAMLANGDEEGAIAMMAALSKDDAAIALGSQDLRDLAVKAFNDDEMARAVSGMKGGTLLQKINWLAAEGSDWALVRRLITQPGVPADQKTELYKYEWTRSFFTNVCDDDEMQEAVRLLGGSVEQKLNWMVTEGTNAKAVFDLATSTTDDKMPAALPADLTAALKDQLSAKDFDHAQRMLTGGLLNWDEVEYRKGEKHYELKDKDDPSKGYELVEFDVHGKYELEFTRTQLTGQGADQVHGRDARLPAPEDLERRHRGQVERQVPHRERAPPDDRVRADLQLRQAASQDRAAPAADRARGRRQLVRRAGRQRGCRHDRRRHRGARVRAPVRHGRRVQPARRGLHAPDRAGGTRRAGAGQGLHLDDGDGRRRRARGREALRALRDVAEPEVPQAGQAVRAQARAMSADLLIAYTRSGGAPPATLESLRVHADGSARAIVTNAWPDGAPQDEAGLYETTLGDGVVAELRALAADPELLGLPASLGEVRSGSGETGLSLAGERKTWGAFAELPDADCSAAEARLRELLAAVRRAPARGGAARARAARRRSSSSWR